MVFLALPPTLDAPKEFCFCGRKTVESHEFLFCSTGCARQDSLRSLGDSNCHYRDVVRRAYVQAGASGLQPRHMASAVRPSPSHFEDRRFKDLPPLPQQSNATLARIAPWTTSEINTVAFPTYPRKGPTRTATAGASVTERHYPSRREKFVNVPPRGHLIPGPGDHTPQQVSPNAIPFPEHTPLVPLRSVPSATEGHNTKKSPVAALVNFGRSPKGKEAENTERAFGSPVNTGNPAGRKEFRRGGYF